MLPSFQLFYPRLPQRVSVITLAVPRLRPISRYCYSSLLDNRERKMGARSRGMYRCNLSIISTTARWCHRRRCIITYGGFTAILFRMTSTPRGPCFLTTFYHHRNITTGNSSGSPQLSPSSRSRSGNSGLSMRNADS